MFFLVICCSFFLFSVRPAPNPSWDAICSLSSTTKLMKMMDSNDCIDFKNKYLNPFSDSSNYWDAPQMYDLVARLNQKSLNREILNVGILGGSISIMWPTSFISYLQLIFNYKSIRLHNGAIGGTGALVPAACLDKIFAKNAMDLVIIEFVINEEHYSILSALVKKLRVRYGGDVPIVVLTLTCREIKRNSGMIEERIKQHKQLAEEFGLIHIDWSSLADKQYGKTYEPKEIWTDSDQSHPNSIGNDWIALSVAVTLYDICQHLMNKIRTHTTTLVVAPPKLDADTLCVSPYVCDEHGDRNEYNEHTQFGKCWYKTKKDAKKKCPKEVFEYDSSHCSYTQHPRENVLKISFHPTAPCTLCFASVGDGIGKHSLHCKLDIYDNEVFAKTLSFKDVHIKQTVHAGLLSPLSPGLHRIDIVPHNITGNKCSIGSIICI
jgi:hypothetical protein